MKIARATQRPGQTKEQTRLIAQGIQKGIDQYKKQQKSKAREADKRKKRSQPEAEQPLAGSAAPEIRYRQHWLPWLLLVLSWIAFAVYLSAGF